MRRLRRRLKRVERGLRRVELGLRRFVRRLPFRVRLTLGFASLMVVLFGGLALLLHTIVETSLDDGINQSLRTYAADIRSLVDNRRQLPALPASEGTFVEIVDVGSHRVRLATPGLTSPRLSDYQLTSAQLTEASRHSILLTDHNQARLLAEPVSTVPEAVLIVGSSLAQRNRAMTTLSEMLFAGGPMLLILTCLAGYWLAARALAPVDAMRAKAARISGARGERLPLPHAHDELHRLGETLNEMLARVEQALLREQSFVADVGHELRTPLTILKLELELAEDSDDTREELQERIHSAAEEVERLTKVARDLLLLARGEQGRLPLELRRVEVGPLLDAVAARFGPGVVLEGRRVRSRTPALQLDVDADRAWLEQALTSLVVNALRHGDGEVILSAVQRNGDVELHVLDDGAGFDPEFLACAFERFARATPNGGAVGAGLGLSIVRVLAEAHGGTACAANREGGGADVWLSLPRPSAVAGAVDEA